MNNPRAVLSTHYPMDAKHYRALDSNITIEHYIKVCNRSRDLVS